jgi:ribose 5-phosphate isomerase A
MPRMDLGIDPATISNLEAKRQIGAQVAAVARDGEVIGAGSGSTSFCVTEALGERVRAGELRDVVVVPTSLEVASTAVHAGLTVLQSGLRRLDWAFDGADEVDPHGSLIKGRGGALLREKLSFDLADRRYVVADASKLVQTLGERFAVPFEVVGEAAEVFAAAVADVGAEAVPRMAGGGKDGPVITEHGNLLIDVRLTPAEEDVVARLERVPGVLTSGAFFGYEAELVTVE